MATELTGAPEVSPAPLSSGATAQRGAGTRGRRRFRRLMRWSTLARNLLGATKDLGIILVVAGLLFFTDEVIDYLEDHGIGWADRGRDVDVPKELGRLNSSANTWPDVVDPAVRVPGRKAQKALRAERRLMRSGDADYINDWAVIVASHNDLALAQLWVDKHEAAASRPVSIYKKRAFRVVVPVDGDNLPRTMATLRSTFPGALLVSLSSWCPSPTRDGAAWICP